MHFVFEEFDEQSRAGFNFVNCPDVNLSGIRRFTPSPIFHAITFLKGKLISYGKDIENISYGSEPKQNEPYIIATGVTHSPDDWCGPDYQNIGLTTKYATRSSVFEHLSEKYLKDLRERTAYLLIDQSHEGYQEPWLWSWFHNNCDFYKINPKQIIYVTGNLNCSLQYTEWANMHKLVNRILPIPYAHFEGMIFDIASKHKKTSLDTVFDKVVEVVNNRVLGKKENIMGSFNLPTTKDHIRYKKQNINSIKIYNALQKRPRAHRAWLFKKLYDAGLLEHGINSMNNFSASNTFFENRSMNLDDCNVLNSMLPMLPLEYPSDAASDVFLSGDGGTYIQYLNETTMLNSWITIVSEASFGDKDNTCFISEKTFKPIACSHPFVIFGNKGSLANLHIMGYKTFHPFIDESYDNLPTWERMDAIIHEVIKINSMSISDRFDWYKKMEPIFHHNLYTLYRNNRIEVNPAISTLLKYIEK